MKEWNLFHGGDNIFLSWASQLVPPTIKLTTNVHL